MLTPLRHVRSLFPWITVGVLSATAFTAMIATPASADSYNAPFVTATQRSFHGKVNLAAECRPAPPPVRDLVADDGTTFRHARTRLYRYQRKLNEISDAYVRSKPPNIVLSQCTLDWLQLWARHDAMLGKIDARGRFIRKSVVAPLALAYLKIEDAPLLDPAALQTVRAWLNRLGHQIKTEFSTNTDSTSRQNHHLAEAIWSVIAAGVASNDQALFEWGVERTRFALTFVTEDGVFSWTRKRGPAALELQLQSVGLLVMSAEMAAANGENLYAANAGALHRLVTETLAMMTDSALRAERLQGKQKGVMPADPEDLAWLWVYRSRFADSANVPPAPVLPASENRNLGGDLPLLYLDAQQRRAAFPVLPEPPTLVSGITSK